MIDMVDLLSVVFVPDLGWLIPMISALVIANGALTFLVWRQIRQIRQIKGEQRHD